MKRKANHTAGGRQGQRFQERKADGDFEAHVAPLSCSKPPPGFARWSLRLLADRVVQLQYIDSVEEIQAKVLAWQNHRDNLQAKVNWQFTTENARVNLRRIYPTVVT